MSAMVQSEQVHQRYRAKAARRPFLFWWQVFLLLGVFIFLWSFLPVTAVLFESRVFSPLSKSHSSYVILDPVYAAQVFKLARAAWARDGQGERSSFEMDLGFFELNNVVSAPTFLTNGLRYPDIWRIAQVERLPQRFVSTPIPSMASSITYAHDAILHGVHVLPDEALSSKAFQASIATSDVCGVQGSARYYVEVGADGRVEHVLAASIKAEGACAAIERMLYRGRATGATRGTVSIVWDLRP